MVKVESFIFGYSLQIGCLTVLCSALVMDNIRLIFNNLLVPVYACARETPKLLIYLHYYNLLWRFVGSLTCILGFIGVYQKNKNYLKCVAFYLLHCIIYELIYMILLVISTSIFSISYSAWNGVLTKLGIFKIPKLLFGFMLVFGFLVQVVVLKYFILVVYSYEKQIKATAKQELQPSTASPPNTEPGPSEPKP